MTLPYPIAWLALTWRRLMRWMAMAMLRARIAQLRSLLTRPERLYHPDHLQSGRLEAKLAELRCQLYALELRQLWDGKP
jgi:hypothetical protein